MYTLMYVQIIVLVNVLLSTEVSRNVVDAFSVNCCGMLSCRTLECQAFIQVPECTPQFPKPLHKHRYICRHIAIAHFFKLTNKVLTLLPLIVACNGVHCGLKYQQWPMKQILAVGQKGFQWHTVPI